MKRLKSTRKEKDNNKLIQIAEILSLMEESHKTKDWLLQQIKNKKLKITVNHSMNSFNILSLAPSKFVSQLLNNLKGGDMGDFADVSSLTKTFHWFFCDIVAGSNPSMVTKDQLRKVIVLNEVISRTEAFRNLDPKNDIILPTGDGYAIGFADSSEKPLRFAIQIHRGLEKYNQSRRGKNKLLLRIGIDTGPVYIIKDLTGKDNVWGPGIIMTRRVMDLAGDMNIFASSRIADDISKLSPEYKSILHSIGDYSIKHGEKLYLYNIYGEGFGNKLAPRKSKLVKKTQDFEEELRAKTSFVFNTIDIKLDVQDIKTMMTHHTWIWNLINISKEPKDQIYYYLDGDVPRDFSKMNVKIFDEKENQLEILNINSNKPTHKEFNVQIQVPIKPKQRKRFLRLEYDWEEPERMFVYKIPTDCKKFTFAFTIPKGVDVKSRILKIDTELGYKWVAKPAPKVEYIPEGTKITWEGKNLKAFDTYQFEW